MSANAPEPSGSPPDPPPSVPTAQAEPPQAVLAAAQTTRRARRANEAGGLSSRHLSAADPIGAAVRQSMQMVADGQQGITCSMELSCHWSFTHDRMDESDDDSDAGVGPMTVSQAMDATSLFVRSDDTAHWDDCRICMAAVVNGAIGRSINTCGHSFHAQCLDQWMAAHSSCPLCRQRMVPYDVGFV